MSLACKHCSTETVPLQSEDEHRLPGSALLDKTMKKNREIILIPPLFAVTHHQERGRARLSGWNRTGGLFQSIYINKFRKKGE